MRSGTGKPIIPIGRSLGIFIIILICAAVAQAGPGNAELTGTILDPSGRSIPDVTLTLVDSITGITRTAVSGKSGLYLFPDLPAGTYHLKANSSRLCAVLPGCHSGRQRISGSWK